MGPEQIPPDDELLAEGFAADRPVAIRDLQARATARPGVLERDGLRAGLLVPLRSRGRVLGLLALADVEPREFSAEEVEMALTLAAVTAVALDSRRGLEDLRQALGEQAARQAEQAEGEKARVLTAFGAGLTRELSAVFALLLGKSQLMLARAPDESLREGLAALEEAAWRGTDVTQRLLGLAEADRAADLSCDLGAIAQEALAFARPRPGAAPAGGRIEMTADLPPTSPVAGSATALREAVVNLVLNAMEAMPAGGSVTVRLREVERRRRAGGRGQRRRHRAGGEAAHLRSLLHDASRAPGPRAHRRPGGRAPRGRARRRGQRSRGHHGHPLAARGAGERGAAVRRIPRGRAGAGARSRGLRPRRPVGSVLIVEEEDGIRSAVLDALAAAGHRVEAAVDATSALDRLALGGIDVVVTDLALRDRSGLQLAAAVKQRSPGAAVVLLTGWGRRLHEERVRGAGVDVMVVKPIEPERVRTAVAEALRLHPPA